MFNTDIYFRKPKSWEEFEAEDIANEQGRLRALSARRQMEEEDRLLAEEQAAYPLAQAGDVGGLRQIGTKTAYTLADSLDERNKKAAENKAKKEKEAQEAKTSAAKDSRAAYGGVASKLSLFKNQQGVKEYLTDAVIREGLSEEDAKLLMAEVPADQADFDSWKQRVLLSATSADKQIETTRKSDADNDKAKKDAKAAELAQKRLDLQEKIQSGMLSVAQQRAAAAEMTALAAMERAARSGGGAQPKPPKDMRYTADGDLEPIPGSETDVKRKAQEQKTAAQASKARAFVQQSSDLMSRIDSAVDKMLSSPALGDGKKTNALDVATGIRGVVARRIPGSDATDFETLKATVVSNLGFKELADMRASSPTGGALGNITNRELELLQSTIAALKSEQSAPSMKAALQEIKRSTAQTRKRLKAAADEDFSEAPKTPAPATGQSLGGGFKLNN